MLWGMSRRAQLDGLAELPENQRPAARAPPHPHRPVPIRDRGQDASGPGQDMVVTAYPK